MYKLIAKNKQDTTTTNKIIDDLLVACYDKGQHEFTYYYHTLNNFDKSRLLENVEDTLELIQYGLDNGLDNGFENGFDNGRDFYENMMRPIINKVVRKYGVTDVIFCDDDNAPDVVQDTDCLLSYDVVGALEEYYLRGMEDLYYYARERTGYSGDSCLPLVSEYCL